MEIHGKGNGGAGVKDETNYERGYRDGKRDALEKIRAEIEFEVDHRTNMLCAEDVFTILDKYKAESEKV